MLNKGELSIERIHKDWILLMGTGDANVEVFRSRYIEGVRHVRNFLTGVDTTLLNAVNMLAMSTGLRPSRESETPKQFQVVGADVASDNIECDD